MRIEVVAILICFTFFTAAVALFLVVKCIMKKTGENSGILEEDEESEDENAYNTTVYVQISASEDESGSEGESVEDDIWND